MEQRWSSSTTSNSAPPRRKPSLSPKREPKRSEAVVEGLLLEPAWGERSDSAAQRLVAVPPLHRAAVAGLKRFQYPQRLADGAAHVGVVVERVLQRALRVDDEGGARGMALLFQQAVIGSRHFALQIGEERKGDRAEAAAHPCLVRVNRIDRATQHRGVQPLELPIAPGELLDLGWAHHSEIEWVEEQHHPFPPVVRQGNLREVSPPYHRVE